MLIYQVMIQSTPELWVGRAFDSDTLTNLIPDWIKENIKGEWNWEHSYVVNTKSWWLVFRFESQTDAAVFKLRWA